MKRSDYTLTTLGLRLREHRQIANITLGDLAGALGLEPFEIAEIETGVMPPRNDYVARAAEYLELGLGLRTELIKLQAGNSQVSEKFYRSRKLAHARARKVLRSLHTWRPALIRGMRSYLDRGIERYD
jgi:transcriptional regulator with XRE-family HTH domain